MQLLHTELVGSSNLSISTKVYAGLAHQVEQLICNHQVVGSSPATGTKFHLSIAQPGSAPALGAGGREFDPLYSDHYYGGLV